MNQEDNQQDQVHQEKEEAATTQVKNNQESKEIKKKQGDNGGEINDQEKQEILKPQPSSQSMKDQQIVSQEPKQGKNQGQTQLFVQNNQNKEKQEHKQLKQDQNNQETKKYQEIKRQNQQEQIQSINKQQCDKQESTKQLKTKQQTTKVQDKRSQNIEQIKKEDNKSQQNKQQKDNKQLEKKEEKNQQQQKKEEENLKVKENSQKVEKRQDQFIKMALSAQNSPKKSKSKIDHTDIGQYANNSMKIEEQEIENIEIKIINHEQRGSKLSKYTVYIIKGYDKHGQIDASRRFSQFHALHQALIKRWPGCFIPSISSKKFLAKNDKEQIQKRIRYLNDFLYKIAMFPHLYNSQEFQAFIKSNEADVSNLYSKWVAPSYESLVNKYRECFTSLNGKQIDQTTNVKITQFISTLKKNASLFEKYRAYAKQLAISKDKFNQLFPKIFDEILPSYEKFFLSEYNQSGLVYLNSEEVKLPEQTSIAREVSRKNPYWLLYDLMKNEERDGKSFFDSYSSLEGFHEKKNSLASKIKSNEKQLKEISTGKKKISKGTPEETRYKLQVENEQLKKSKEMLEYLLDIISALLVFIEIPNYQKNRAQFYRNTLKKIAGYQINAVQMCAEIWSNTSMSCTKVAFEHNIRLNL